MDTIDWVALGLLALHVMLALAAAVYVSMNRNPSSAIAWVMAVVFIPLLGILFFLLVGAGRLPKSRRDAQRQVSEYILERTEGGLDRLWSSREKWPDWLPSITVLNRNLGALPMIGGNVATLNGDYLKAIKAIADDIDLARDYVHIEYFILVYDDTTQPVFDALRRARERGVTVRVLSDHMAQFAYPNRKETVKMLTDMGAQYYPMLPIQPFRGQLRRIDMRNHRKIVVIDGLIAHAGSQNLIVDNYHLKKNIARGLHWRELVARFEGPIVRELDAVFLTDWFSESGEPCWRPGAGRARRSARRLGRPGGTQRSEFRERQQPQAVRRRDPECEAAREPDQPVLRARRVDHDGHGHRGIAWARGGVVRFRGQRPVRGFPRAALVL